MTAQFDINQIRQQFPALAQDCNGQPLVYLDSAATTQKPKIVIEAIQQYYSGHNANVHRGSHTLTAAATAQFEQARTTVQQFINAKHNKEIIWTRGATEALNLIAQTNARQSLKPDDEILVSELEHHANIVPWQIVAEQTGAKIVKIPMTTDCTLDMTAFHQRLGSRTKIVAVAHITNVTGTRNPVEEIIAAAHQQGAVTVIDGAQAVAHEKVDVQALNADFYVFFLVIRFLPRQALAYCTEKKELLEAMPPWHGGGKMVEKVSFEGTTFSALPGKFEAGTPNVAGSLALATAINWLDELDRKAAEHHIHQLRQQALDGIKDIEDLRIIGLQPMPAYFPLSSMGFTIKTLPPCSTNKVSRCVPAITVPIQCWMPWD